MENTIIVDETALSRIREQLRTAGNQLQYAETQLKRIHPERSAGANLRVCGSIRLRSAGRQYGASTIAEAITACGLAARTLEGSSERLGQSVSNALGLFLALERELRHNVTGIENDPEGNGGGGAFSIDSILFDSRGAYGGNQGSMADIYRWDPVRCWELLGYLREYFPGMSIMAAFSYFDHLNSVGCGYVALANTLFREYEGRPEEFEQTFGYPMFRDGDLNYDRLILDIYATTDLAGFNDGRNGMPGGTWDDTRAQIMENFLSSHNVNVSTEANATVTANNFRQITEEGGHVVLGYRNGTMYDVNGNAHPINGGHAIMVTGVTDDGRYIVSSWGEQYFINASDIGSDDTFMVFYYDS